MTNSLYHDTLTHMTNHYILLAHLPKDTDLPEFKLGEVSACEWHIYDEKELPRAKAKMTYYQTIFKNVQLRSCSNIITSYQLVSTN